MILVICGPPGAGKTSIAVQLRRELEDRERTVEVVHSDDFSRRTYEQLFDRVRDVPPGTITVVDGTFYNQEWQDRFRTLDDVRFVHVTASLETCLERNRERADSIDEQGVHVVYREFSEPDADLRIGTEEHTVAEAAAKLLDALSSWGWLDGAEDAIREGGADRRTDADRRGDAGRETDADR